MTQAGYRARATFSMYEGISNYYCVTRLPWISNAKPRNLNSKKNGRSKMQKTAREIMDELQTVHYDELLSKETPWRGYKDMSLRAIKEAPRISGNFAEFGVYKGYSADLMLSFLSPSEKLYLFDSFDGLPEDWISVWKKGAFSLSEEQRPSFSDQRVVVIKGLFKDTINFQQGEVLSFIHIDCDLYSSTLDALTKSNNAIWPGTLILFDEYEMNSNGEYSDDEHRALYEWSEKCGRKFDYLWRTKSTQVAIRITR